MPRESSTKNDNVTSSSDQNTGQHRYNFQAKQTLSVKANNRWVKPSGPSYRSKGASGHRYMPYGVKPKPKWAEKSIPDLQTLLPTSYRNVGVQTMDAGKYHQLAFKANCGIDSGQVDGWASEGLISELKIKIKKLERCRSLCRGNVKVLGVLEKWMLVGWCWQVWFGWGVTDFLVISISISGVWWVLQHKHRIAHWNISI